MSSAPDPIDIASLPPEQAYFNREISWLSFNERVLAEANNTAYPLLERLRFLSISGSNLDEFMMIRVAGLAGQIRSGVSQTSIDGRTAKQQLAAIGEKFRELERMQQSALSTLQPLLEAQGIHIKGEDRIDEKAEEWLRAYFLDHIMPVITPQAIDPAHPFPFVANLGVGALFNLERISDGSQLVEMVLIPSALPRFIRIPAEVLGDEAIYVAVERLVCRFGEELFPGFHVRGDGVFRVLRDSDIEVEEEAEDLVRYFRSAIQRRRRGQVIMLEIDSSFDPDAEELAARQAGAGTGVRYQD